MKRIADFLNFCIVTNRDCNLRCKHCFVSPELFSSKERMSIEVYKLAYRRLFEIISLAPKLKFLNVEALGGEITRMPIEFWAEAIPFTLEQHSKLKSILGKASTYLFCTNLIIKDEGYFDLINKYKNDQNWSVFIPWEPDTNRFGKEDKLFPRYWEAVQKIEAKKAFNFIPTKTVINMDFSKIISLIDEGGFTDVSCDMLYPFGYGEEFFNENQPQYSDVSDFYKKTSEQLGGRSNFDLSPWDEYSSCLLSDSSLNINGNELLDISIEPDGSVFLNSSITGVFSKKSTIALNVSDPMFALKVLFESCQQMHIKFDKCWDHCHDCDYLRYCNGGYFYHKEIDLDKVKSLSKNDCSGLKRFWDYCAEKTGATDKIISRENHKKEITKIRSTSFSQRPPIQNSFSESTESHIDYFNKINKSKKENLRVILTDSVLFGKSVVERLWFYEAIGMKVAIDEALLLALDLPSLETIARNIANETYENIDLPDSVVFFYTNKHPERLFSKQVRMMTEVMSSEITINDDTGYSKLFGVLDISPKSDEFIRFSIRNKSSNSNIFCMSRSSFECIKNIENNLEIESAMRSLRHDKKSCL